MRIGSFTLILQGFVLTPAVCIIFLLRASEEEYELPFYTVSVWLFGLGAILELLSEPMYSLAQHMQLYKTRLFVEAVAVLIRCIITYVAAVFFEVLE